MSRRQKLNFNAGLQASPHLLRNCGVALGGQVQIAKLDVSGACLIPLTSVALEPQTSLPLSGGELAELAPYVSQLLGSLEFICLHNTLDFAVAGKPVRFRVASLESTPETKHHIEAYSVGHFIPGITKVILEHRQEAPQQDPDAGFSNIGGLKNQIAELQSVLKLVMGEDIFSEFGLTPPKGVLLYGPPGTGKTLVAKAAALTAGATPFLVSAPELVSRFVGETEQKIKDLFARAQDSQPAVICFDEIDSLCPQRDKVTWRVPCSSQPVAIRA